MHFSALIRNVKKTGNNKWAENFIESINLMTYSPFIAEGCLSRYSNLWCCWIMCFINQQQYFIEGKIPLRDTCHSLQLEFNYFHDEEARRSDKNLTHKAMKIRKENAIKRENIVWFAQKHETVSSDWDFLVSVPLSLRVFLNIGINFAFV